MEAGEYFNSLVAWVTTETTVGSGVVVTTFTDPGIGTQTGQPPQVSQLVGSPPPISLTDGSEVSGKLPPGRNVIPVTVTFSFGGVLEPQIGEFVWPFEYTEGWIVSARATLGRSSSPAVQPVIVDVNKYDTNAATPFWDTIYTTQANRPVVEVGEFVGDPTEPDIQHMLNGDLLTVDVDQAGGGASPTDEDLLVTLLMFVYAGDEDTSFVFP